MKKFKKALFIGRFQPFHNGHLYSLKKCLEVADKVIVAVGSSQEQGTESNPWGYKARKEMIEGVVKELPAQVVALPDLFDDKKWGEQILSLLKEKGFKTFEVVGVGNNDWTNRIFRALGIDVHETGLYKRDELEGIKIRKLMKEGDTSWKVRVPKGVVEYLEKYEKEN